MAKSTRSEGNRPGQERSDNGAGIVLCWCPPGSFRMGCDDVFDAMEMRFVTPEEVEARRWSPRPPAAPVEGDAGADEGGSCDEDEDDENDDDFDPTEDWARIDVESPVAVTLSRGFWIGKCPVTQAQYEVVMGPGSHFSKFRDRDDSARRPVQMINWGDAVTFCRELTELERAAGRLPEGWIYRLPTEAQWEYACRAGSRSRHYAGEYEADLERVAFFRTRAGALDPVARKAEQPRAVGQKAPNAWGLHDTLGNVQEWCRDAFAPALPGGTDPFALPVGKSVERVIRGGSYCKKDYDCRVSSRTSWAPDERLPSVGFRVALVRPANGEPVDPLERAAKSVRLTRRKAAVEGRPIPEPPATHNDLRARIQAFLDRPDPGTDPLGLYAKIDSLLRAYLAATPSPDEVRKKIAFPLHATQEALRALHGEEEDHMLERAALGRGIYRLVCGVDPSEDHG